MQKNHDANTSIRESIYSGCQGINKFFVIAYEGGTNRVTVNSHRRYFLPGAEMKSYSIEIDGRNFYDQLTDNQETNDLIKQYGEVTKVSTRQCYD